MQSTSSHLLPYFSNLKQHTKVMNNNIGTACSEHPMNSEVLEKYLVKILNIHWIHTCEKDCFKIPILIPISEEEKNS